ncbi:MAG TPA: AbrB/MazE/SpoVT family DNA-binding domain-containing protein [Firmicutes bacterium]|nr:AbrB/MazE/SpoVT family DNA-binding domain-containing protein [Bacillota bacterium]
MMIKSTGIVRPLDNLGRVVIPKELRVNFNLKEKDPVEIFVNDDMIILKKYAPGCIFCGNITDLTTYHDKHICKNCLEELAKKN